MKNQSKNFLVENKIKVKLERRWKKHYFFIVINE